jgi:hypothetical protein
MAKDERVQYKFMIPADLKQRLERAAVDARRSLSAEIILRLEDSIDKKPALSNDPLINERDFLETLLSSRRLEAQTIEAEIAQVHERLIALDRAIKARESSSDD